MLTTTEDDIAAEQAVQDHEPDEIIDRLRELGVSVEELLTEDGWQRWLELAGRFHRYSFANMVLIAFQRPDATAVAGYQRWRELGRQVQHGERSIKIWAPRTKKQRDDDGEERRVLTGFGVAHVFDVSQTAGEPLPEMPPRPVLDDAVIPGLFDDLVQQVTAVGKIDVWTPRPDETGGHSPEARGWYDIAERRIAVRLDYYDSDHSIVTLPPAQRVKTLIHELGHHFDPALNLLQRSECEVVAESVAWLVTRDMGLDSTLGAAHYLAGWDPTGRALMAVGSRIKTAYEAVTNLLTVPIDVDHPVSEQVAA